MNGPSLKTCSLLNDGVIAAHGPSDAVGIADDVVFVRDQHDTGS